MLRQLDAGSILDGLASAEVRYTRYMENAEAIAIGRRTNIYAMQKLPPGRRIVAFHGKDAGGQLTCAA